jgi:hypothetical protein
MSRIIRQDDGTQWEVSDVNFQIVAEPTTEILLDDGTVIRVRLVVSEVTRIEGEPDALGKPRYLVNTTNIMTVLPTS